MEELHRRVRACALVLIAGLVLSGATAIPIPTAFDVARNLLGSDLSGGGRLPEFAALWLRTVDEGVRFTATRAPFIYYGTDWLAFGHFVIAVAFLGALRDPVRNCWLFEFGMVACAAVPVWALAFGELRGIPLWWRAIDASFGIVGFVPAWLGHRWTGEMERVQGAWGPTPLR